MIALGLAILLAAAPGAGKKASREKARSRPPPAATAPADERSAPHLAPQAREPGASGSVAYATARRGYLDAGALDGVAPGVEVHLARQGRPAGSCRVELVADHSATCTGEGLRPGDTFAIRPRREAAPPPALPPSVPAAEQARRFALVNAAAFQQVEARPTARAAPTAWRRAEVFAGYQGFAGYGDGPLHQERVDVRLHGVEVGRGFRAQLDLTALHWSRRDTERFRPGADTQLYVWAAELARRDPGLALAFGRVRAWHAPGATIFDGAQVGWRSAGGSEVGIYAGGVPDPVTTSPTFARRTAGGYFGLQQQGAAAVFRQEGRVALVDSPELGRRLEAEVLGQAWLGRGLSAGAGVRFGLGDHQAPAALDVLRIDVSARLRERFGLSGSFRYLGLSSAGIPTTVAAGLAPSRHADLAATFDATRWLTVAASGGYARDVASGLERTWFGPEVSFPRLLGRRGGLSAGWHEERGWLAGRAVYLQAVAQPFDRWSLVGRASWFRDARPGPGADDDEVGLFASTRADLSSWLQFRLSVLGRMALGRAGPEGPYPSGVTGLAGFAGSY